MTMVGTKMKRDPKKNLRRLKERYWEESYCWPLIRILNLFD